jgi:hypothetical protein
MKTKICSKCNIEKELSEFSKDKSKKDGLCSQCKICRNEHFEIYKKNNKNKIDKKQKEYRLENIKKSSERNKKYRDNHRNKINKQRRKRRQTDINFKILDNLRRRLSKALKGKINSIKTLGFLDCSIEQLKVHLESQFTKGMSWDNHGDWHIDHRKPCASFDLSKPEEQLQCFHYTNLQPLWAIDNLKKGCKLTLTKL